MSRRGERLEQPSKWFIYLSIFKSKLKTFFKRSQLILNLDIFCIIDFKILIFKFVLLVNIFNFFCSN